MIVTTGEVLADYSQIELHPGQGGHLHGLGDVGLATGEHEHAVVLTTARHDGPVPVEVQVLDAEPPLDPTWDAVVEVSLRTGDGPTVCGWAGSGVVELPVPADVDLRVRYVVVDGQLGSEQSRDVEVVGSSPAERYLVQAWPAPATQARTVVATSPWSQYWAFGPAAAALVAELADVPDPERLVVVVDRALAAHPEVAAALLAGDERFQLGIIRYAQEVFRVAYDSKVYDDASHDAARVRHLIAERVERT